MITETEAGPLEESDLETTTEDDGHVTDEVTDEATDGDDRRRRDAGDTAEEKGK